MTEIGHKTQFSIWQMTFNIQQHRRDVFYKEPCNTSNNWWNIIEPGLPKSTLKVMWLLQAQPTGLDMVMKVTQHNTTPGIPGPAAVLLLLSAWLCSKTWEPAVVLPRPVLCCGIWAPCAHTSQFCLLCADAALKMGREEDTRGEWWSDTSWQISVVEWTSCWPDVRLRWF